MLSVDQAGYQNLYKPPSECVSEILQGCVQRWRRGALGFFEVNIVQIIKSCMYQTLISLKHIGIASKNKEGVAKYSCFSHPQQKILYDSVTYGT